MGYTNSFTAGTTARSADVNKNFTEAVRCVNYQDNTSNSIVASQTICYGWGFIAGNNTINLSESVTMPITYDAAPCVIMGSMGYRSGSSPSTVGDINAAHSAVVMTDCYATTTSTFTTQLRVEVGYTFGAADTFGYTWLAIGTKA